VEELAQKFDSQTKTLMELITELREENKGLKAQLAENTNTMNKVLSLPTIQKELIKAKEKVKID
jgi:seryl-tRNA synthetase